MLFIKQSMFFLNFSLWIFATTHSMQNQRMQDQNNPCKIKSVQDQIADWTKNLYSHIDFDLMAKNKIFDLMLSGTKMHKESNLIEAMQKDGDAILDLITTNKDIDEKTLFSQENMKNISTFFKKLENKEQKEQKEQKETRIRKIIDMQMALLDENDPKWRDELSNQMENKENEIFIKAERYEINEIFIKATRYEINDEELEKTIDTYLNNSEELKDFSFFTTLQNALKDQNDKEVYAKEFKKAIIIFSDELWEHFSSHIKKVFIEKYDEIKDKITENKEKHLEIENKYLEIKDKIKEKKDNKKEKEIAKEMEIEAKEVFDEIQNNIKNREEIENKTKEILSEITKIPYLFDNRYCNDLVNFILKDKDKDIESFFSKKEKKSSPRPEYIKKKIISIIKKYIQYFNKIDDKKINHKLLQNLEVIKKKDSIKINEEKLKIEIEKFFSSDAKIDSLKNFHFIKILNNLLNPQSGDEMKEYPEDIEGSILDFSHEIKFIFIDSLRKSKENNEITKLINYIKNKTKTETEKEIENDLYNEDPFKIIIKNNEGLYKNIIATGICINKQMNNGVFFNSAAREIKPAPFSVKTLDDDHCDVNHKSFNYSKCLFKIVTNIEQSKKISNDLFPFTSVYRNTLAVYFNPFNESKTINHSDFVDAFCSDAEFKISVIDPLELQLGFNQESINTKNIPHWNMFSGTANMFNHDNVHHNESNFLIKGRLKTKLRMVCSIRKNLMEKDEHNDKDEHKDKNKAQVLTNAIFFLFHEVPSNIFPYYASVTKRYRNAYIEKIINKKNIDEMIKKGKLDQFIEITKKTITEQFSSKSYSNRKNTLYKRDYRDHETYLKDITDSKGVLFYPKKEERAFSYQQKRAIEILKKINKNKNESLEKIEKEIDENNDDGLFSKLDQAFKIKFKMEKLMKLHPIAYLSAFRNPSKKFKGLPQKNVQHFSFFSAALFVAFQQEENVVKKNILNKAHEYSQKIQSWITEKKWQEAVKLDATNEHNDVIELYLKNQIEQIERKKSETKDKQMLEKYEETQSLLEEVIFEYKEKLTPQEVGEKLNNLLDYFVDIVREHDPEHKIINKEEEKRNVIESHNNKN